MKRRRPTGQRMIVLGGQAAVLAVRRACRQAATDVGLSAATVALILAALTEVLRALPASDVEEGSVVVGPAQRPGRRGLCIEIRPTAVTPGTAGPELKAALSVLQGVVDDTTLDVTARHWHLFAWADGTVAAE